MPSIILAAVAAVVTAVAQSGFVRALPVPAAAVDLPLILVIALVTRFRFAEAFAAAIVAGLAMDALSSLPFGTHLVLMALMTGATVALFTRVFTHHSWAGTLGINAAVFLLSRAALAAVRVTRAVFAGLPAAGPIDGGTAAAVAGALGLQLLAALVLLALSAVLGRSFRRFFFVR
jgi:rod shape-determining protein MreD